MDFGSHRLCGIAKVSIPSVVAILLLSLLIRFLLSHRRHACDFSSSHENQASVRQMVPLIQPELASVVYVPTLLSSPSCARVV